MDAKKKKEARDRSSRSSTAKKKKKNGAAKIQNRPKQQGFKVVNHSKKKHM